MQDKNKPGAMAFYHPNGLVAAHQQAMKFAGKDGRLATLPDIIAARLATKPGTVAWEQHFTTMSAEYFGLSRGGNRILIVAHGVGPMATLDGILGAYSYHFKDKTRDHRGGRISQQQFLDLENGKYGEVAIVDFEAIVQRYEYPFLGTITGVQALLEPLIEARFGPRWKEYIIYHARLAREWHAQQAEVVPDNRYGLPNWNDTVRRQQAMHRSFAERPSDPFILQMGDASNCCYGYRDRDGAFVSHLEQREAPFAHLLSIGGLCHLHHDRGNISLTSDVDCHEWSNGVRLCAIREGMPSDIHPGVDNMHKLMAANNGRLMRPCAASGCALGFFALMDFGKGVFTQYPKMGEGMDTYAPEFRVTKIERIKSGPTIFRTTIGGYHGFFKYGIDEVERIAPVGANAYRLPAEVKIERDGDGNMTFHVTPIKFYKVEIDATQRMLRGDDIYNDFDLLMELLETNAA